MRILITGNMGYIGPSVIDQLRRSYAGAFLAGFDIGYFGNCITNPDILPESRLDIQRFGDVRQFPEDYLAGVDAIVHLAAISNDPIGNRFEEVTLDVNHRASIDLARMAKKAGVKSFVFASSCSMYGSADDSARTETSQLNPLSAYAKSKVYTERDLEPFAGDDFLVTCLRFSTACGWSDRLRLDLVLNDFVAGAVTSGAITILSDGTPWRPLINTKDMALAIDWAIGRDGDCGGQFLAVNIGSDEWNYQVKDLADVVAQVIPDTTVSINPDAQPDKRSYKVDFGRFHKLAPDHQPRVGLATAVREIRDGLASISFRDGQFRDSRYMRLNMLSELQEKKLLNDRLEWIGGN